MEDNIIRLTKNKRRNKNKGEPLALIQKPVLIPQSTFSSSSTFRPVPSIFTIFDRVFIPLTHIPPTLPPKTKVFKPRVERVKPMML